MKREVLSPVVETLLKGRDAVEKDWCQGFGQDGQVCAMDALWVGGDIVPGAGKATSCLWRVLPGGWVSIIHFNDDPATTKADILDLYTRAIRLALDEEK